MRNYYRWAALAGAAILAATNVSTAWAEEGVQAGATFETAVEVPAPGGQAGAGSGTPDTAGSGTPDTAGSGTQDTAGSGTQMPGEVISSGDGGSQPVTGTGEGAVQAPAAGGEGEQASGLPPKHFFHPGDPDGRGRQCKRWICVGRDIRPRGHFFSRRREC